MGHLVLFLAANPTGTDRAAFDREAHAIQHELERSSNRDCFELVTRWAVEPLDVLRELRELRPTVVHFGAHDSESVDAVEHVGDAAKPGLHGLFLQGADGQRRLVTALALQQAFGAAGSSVKLVVLSECYSDAQAKAFLAHIDFVVGMRGPIRNDAARTFAIGFYGGLAAGESVAAAYQQGCAAISLLGLSDDRRPQLTCRSNADAEQFTLVPAARPATDKRHDAMSAGAGLHVLSSTPLLGRDTEPRVGSVAEFEAVVAGFLRSSCSYQAYLRFARAALARPSAALPPLLDAIEQHDDVAHDRLPVAAVLGKVLGKAPDLDAERRLSSAMREGVVPEVRRRAIVAAGHTGDLRWIESILDVTRSSRTWREHLSASAFDASSRLVSRGDSTDLGRLYSFVQETSAMPESFERVGFDRWRFCDSYSTRLADEFIAIWLHGDQDPHIARFGCDALGAMRLPRGVSALANWLYSREVAPAAIAGLARIGTREAFDVLSSSIPDWRDLLGGRGRSGHELLEHAVVHAVGCFALSSEIPLDVDDLRTLVCDARLGADMLARVAYGLCRRTRDPHDLLLVRDLPSRGIGRAALDLVRATAALATVQDGPVRGCTGLLTEMARDTEPGLPSLLVATSLVLSGDDRALPQVVAAAHASQGEWWNEFYAAAIMAILQRTADGAAYVQEARQLIELDG